MPFSRPHHFAAATDQLIAVAQPELEVEQLPRRLRRVRSDEDAARRKIGEVLVDETAEAIELQLNAMRQRYASGVARRIGVVRHRLVARVVAIGVVGGRGPTPPDLLLVRSHDCAGMIHESPAPTPPARRERVLACRFPSRGPASLSLPYEQKTCADRRS